MKIKPLITIIMSLSLLIPVNVYAYSSLEVIEWADDKGAVEQYNIVTDLKGLKGVTDKNGTVIMDIVYKDIKLLPGWNKFAVQKLSGKWSVIDLSGKSYLKNTYDYIDTQYCDKGFLEVGFYGENEFKNNVGIVDKNMNLIVPVEYQTYIYTNKNELLLGKLNSDNRYDYYKLQEDNTLEYVKTLPGILSADNKNGNYYVTSYKVCNEYNAESEKYTRGYITTLGMADENYNIIIEPIYENTVFSFNNNLAIVKKDSTYYESTPTGKTGNGKYGIVDRNGNEIVPCTYDSIVRKGTNYALTHNSEKTTLSVNELYSTDDSTIKILINGTLLNSDNKPVIINNSAMLPLRDIAEALNARVSWNSASKTAVISKDNVAVSITVGSDIMLVGNKSVPVSQPAQIIDNITYVPLRSLASALNCIINWDSTNKVITITSVKN